MEDSVVDAQERELRPGDRIRVVDGSFADFVATIEAVDLERHKRILDIIPVAEARDCVLTAERYADGDASEAELMASVGKSMSVCNDLPLLEEGDGGWSWHEAGSVIGRGRSAWSRSWHPSGQTPSQREPERDER